MLNINNSLYVVNHLESLSLNCLFRGDLDHNSCENKVGKVDLGELARQNLEQMPAVGKRRTTRVFGARVLRSGRRLWTAEPIHLGKQQHMKAAANLEEEWIELLDNSSDNTITCKENVHDDAIRFDEEASEMNIDKKTSEQPGLGTVGKMWGAVYQRKRKRLDLTTSVNSFGNSDRRYGKQFFRKQSRKRIKESPTGTADTNLSVVGKYVFPGGSHTCRGLTVVIETSCGSSSFGVFSCFLNLVLRYMRRFRIRLRQLSSFLISKPIVRGYTLHGIRFLQNSKSITCSGVCEILGSRCCVPLFSVDFSALPFCFMYLHTSLFLRLGSLPYAFVLYLNGMEADSDRMTDDEEQTSFIPCVEDKSGGKTVLSVRRNSGRRKILRQSAAAPKLAARTLQLRNGVGSRSIQKKRSSLRTRRARNHSAFGIRNANGSLLTDLSFRHDGIPYSTVTSNHKLISPVRRSSAIDVKELKSTTVGLNYDVDTSSCSANILVIDSDKCYREEGATITLEISSSNQWVLAVKRDGIDRYKLVAQKVMRPCSCNRITHAIIWSSDIGWKLEFPNRMDWMIFKRLYKECSDRSVRPSTSSIIPVPGVLEVSSYADSNAVPFRRPDSYISCKDDELTRALVKGTANYDLDTEDEVWLDKFNNEVFPVDESSKRVSVDMFETIINSFEKGLYFGQDDYTDVRIAVEGCIHLERREVLEAVHVYWMRKRKQKRSALVRVFQCYQPRRTKVLPNAILRKKRSFKRQVGKAGRGKQRTFLQAMAAEQDAFDEQKTTLKVQEAKAAANRSEGVAVLKRQKAQLLMETADLVTYKAMMALRIAEAARLSDSPDATVSLYLGE